MSSTTTSGPPPSGSRPRRRSLRVALSGAIAISLLATGTAVGATPVASPAAEPTTTSVEDGPTPVPARVGPPVSVAVLGDSISQGTGADAGGVSVSHQDGGIGSPRLRNSWATGDWPGLDSYLQRVQALPGGGATVGINLSANGANMRNNFLDQATSVPPGTGLVLVQMGGNDLCRPSQGEMTPVATYRQQLRAGLSWLQVNRPDTLVKVASVPDIYNLWYVRGAAHQNERFGIWPFQSTAAGPRVARTSGETNPAALFGARFLWDGFFGSVIPCKSLLENPDQPRNAGPTPTATHQDEQRRLAVRQRTMDFNTVLEEECAAMLRCRFDDRAMFDFSTNRVGPANLLTHDRSQWQFLDRDISRQDHFHPSFHGQRKLAEQAFLAGYDFADRTAPEVTVSADRPATAAGWYNADVTVSTSATDAAGVRGIERRIHATNGSVGSWSPSLNATAPVTQVTAEGITHVEARALDRNGNQSASEIVTVRIDRTAPQVHPVTPADGGTFVQGEEVAAAFTCSDAGGSDVSSCTGTARNGDPIDTSTVGEKTFTVTAVDGAGNETTETRSYTVIDVTPPEIDLRNPAVDTVLEHREDSAADYSCTDEPGGSGLATCEGTVPDGDPIPTGTLGAQDFTVDATDHDGNAASVIRTYTVVDVTAPEIELTTPADDAVFAHHEEVLAEFTCTDEEGGSGIADGFCEGTAAAGEEIDTSTLGDHTFTVTATDRAGNVSEVAHTYTVVDVTAPTVSSPHEEIEYKLGQPVEAQFTCTDEVGGSGVASCDGPDLLDTSSVGTKTFDVTTRDGAGNEATVTFAYRVIYAYGEIRQPIDPDGSSVFRAGRVVPVKFAVTDWDHVPVGSATARLSQVKMYGGEVIPDSEVEAVTNVSATPGNLFRYDAGEQQYIFNWSTRGMEPGTYQLFIRLDDGKSYTAVLTLR
jgi:lysophospholipase L1-like esterase